MADPADFDLGGVTDRDIPAEYPLEPLREVAAQLLPWFEEPFGVGTEINGAPLAHQSPLVGMVDVPEEAERLH
jgi:hypothetical protein